MEPQRVLCLRFCLYSCRWCCAWSTAYPAAKGVVPGEVLIQLQRLLCLEICLLGCRGFYIGTSRRKAFKNMNLSGIYRLVQQGYLLMQMLFVLLQKVLQKNYCVHHSLPLKKSPNGMRRLRGSYISMPVYPPAKGTAVRIDVRFLWRKSAGTVVGLLVSQFCSHRSTVVRAVPLSSQYCLHHSTVCPWDKARMRSRWGP